MNLREDLNLSFTLLAKGLPWSKRFWKGARVGLFQQPNLVTHKTHLKTQSISSFVVVLYTILFHFFQLQGKAICYYPYILTISEHQKMAAMAALQSSMTSLSLSSNSFLGQRLSPPTVYPVTVPYPTNPLTFFVFSILLCLVAFKLVVHCYMKFHHDFLLKL